MILRQLTAAQGMRNHPEQSCDRVALDEAQGLPQRLGEASAEAEPVAWRVRVRSNDAEEWSLLPAGGGADFADRKGYDCQPLYAHPPAAQTVQNAARQKPAASCMT